MRDCVFAVAGASTRPWAAPTSTTRSGLTVPRRSLYFQHAAEKQMEFLQIFDAAGVTECYRRKESILPQQALALANSELSLRMARRLARNALGPRSAPTRRASSTPHSSGCSRARRPTPNAPSACATSGKMHGSRRRESLVHVLFNHHDFVTIR